MSDHIDTRDGWHEITGYVSARRNGEQLVHYDETGAARRWIRQDALAPLPTEPGYYLAESEHLVVELLNSPAGQWVDAGDRQYLDTDAVQTLAPLQRLVLESDNRIAQDWTGRPTAGDIHSERQRQIAVEGYTYDHDAEDDHWCELLDAALHYITDGSGPLVAWPWSNSPKRRDFRADLTRAGALILAAIDAVAHKTTPSDPRDRTARILAAIRRIDGETAPGESSNRAALLNLLREHDWTDDDYMERLADTILTLLDSGPR